MSTLHATFRRILAGAAISAAGLVLVWSTPANAACTAAAGPGNFASIVQDGAVDSNATIQQHAGSNGDSGCANQSGSGDFLVIRQDGGALSSVAEIHQIGPSVNRSAYVIQRAANDQATVSQEQTNGATTRGGESLLNSGQLGVLANTHPTSAYSAVIWQQGSNDIASIDQQSGANGSYAEISQGANGSTASILQRNTLTAAILGNFASITQTFSTDTGDNATISQNGGDNYAALLQKGSNLTGSIAQTNDGNTASLTQSGVNLTYGIAQNGSQTNAGGITFSGVTDVTVVQTASGSNITVH